MLKMRKILTRRSLSLKILIPIYPKLSNIEGTIIGPGVLVSLKNLFGIFAML